MLLPWVAALQVMAQLQSRITSMQSQLLIGGQKVEDLPQFRLLQGYGSQHTFSDPIVAAMAASWAASGLNT